MNYTFTNLIMALFKKEQPKKHRKPYVMKTQSKEKKIVDTIRYELNGSGNLDGIIRAYKRRYHEQIKRTTTIGTLSTLKKKGIIYTSGRPACIYSLYKREMEKLKEQQTKK